ncbi:hypothetical protein BH11VER1_BH11VER1_10310 [soil metagenome]
MKLMFPILFVSLIATSVVSAAEDTPVDFVKQIKPVFEERCVECHNSTTLLGEFNIQNRELALKKRNNGPGIVPGEPFRSPLLLTLTLPPNDRKTMPATGHLLSKKDIDLISRWIKEGAKWPEGEAGAIRPKKSVKQKGE